MSKQQPTSKKPVVKLPFPMPSAEEKAQMDALHNQIRPKDEGYADKLFPPPRGTRKSMGKR
ncbi:hypothetical protein [Acinetobacter indicus]|uniref:hypothetical protein n=1 Tax=Acinetobacter indicus TaxID=756892 RepID=UPI001443F246|nr:hypothetical protein [Acinetobacter indicus]